MLNERCGNLDDMATPLLLHRLDRCLSDKEKAVEIGRENSIVLFGGVLGEGGRDKDARIVDKGINAPEMLDCLPDDPRSSFRIANIARDGQNIRIFRWLERTGRRDDAIVAVEIGLNQCFTDALRRAGDYCDFLLGFHGGYPWFGVWSGPRRLPH